MCAILNSTNEQCKKHEYPPKGIYEEVDDSGRGERGM